MNRWQDWLFAAGGLLVGLLCFLFFLSLPLIVLGSEAEAVEQSVGVALGELVVYLLGALGIGAGGVKGYDAWRSRNGNESVVNGSVVKHRVGAVEQALQDLDKRFKAHVDVLHTRIDKVKDEQGLIRVQLTEIGRDVSFLRGKAEQ